MIQLPKSIDETIELLTQENYICGRALGTVVFLSLKLGRPMFLEGEAGTGKTEIAKAIAAALGRRLIRLQCYEGLDASSAVYEWNFPAQMVAIRTAEATGTANRDALQAELFSDDYLTARPLLEAMRPQDGGPPVLLIDELDRADAPFEAFLMEALSDFQVTIPELGTIKAAEPPIVILTSNRTREVHDALKRRCLYHWVDYPDFDREMTILKARAPEAQEALSREIVGFVQKLRKEDLFKSPGVAETIDWAKCLLALDVIAMSPEVIADTLGAILKYQDDIQKIQGSEAKRILDEVREVLVPALFYLVHKYSGGLGAGPQSRSDGGASAPRYPRRRQACRQHHVVCACVAGGWRSCGAGPSDRRHSRGGGGGVHPQTRLFLRFAGLLRLTPGTPHDFRANIPAVLARPALSGTHDSGAQPHDTRRPRRTDGQARREARG
jgi:MoxR-like ATPase